LPDLIDALAAGPLPLGQCVLELRQRRHDPFITMGRDRIEHAARQARGSFGLRRQAIG
jgi:hypothetical protein